MDFVIFGSKEKVSRNGVPLQKTSSIYYIYIIYILYPKKILSPKLLSQQKKKGRQIPFTSVLMKRTLLFFLSLSLFSPLFHISLLRGERTIEQVGRSLARRRRADANTATSLLRSLGGDRPSTDWRNDRLKRTNRRNVQLCT